MMALLPVGLNLSLFYRQGSRYSLSVKDFYRRRKSLIRDVFIGMAMLGLILLYNPLTLGVFFILL